MRADEILDSAKALAEEKGVNLEQAMAAFKLQFLSDALYMIDNLSCSLNMLCEIVNTDEAE